MPVKKVLEVCTNPIMEKVQVVSCLAALKHISTLEVILNTEKNIAD